MQLVRAIWFQFKARIFGKGTIAKLGHNGGKINVILHRTASTKVLYANPPDWPHMLLWERCLNNGDLFLDIGANIGSYSILAASLGAKVIAVEPATDTVELPKDNIRLNNMSIEVINSAVGSKSGKMSFSTNLDTVNRYDPDGTTLVDVTTLDEIIGDRIVSGMKIDIEGYEIEALKGCAKALSEHRIQLLQLEWNSAADRKPIEQLLTEHDYILMVPTPDAELIPWNFNATYSEDDLFAIPISKSNP